MAAAHEGAGLENSLGFNITLPFEQHANHTGGRQRQPAVVPLFLPAQAVLRQKPTPWCSAPAASAPRRGTWKCWTPGTDRRDPLVPIVLLDQPGGRCWEHALEFVQERLLENHYILPADMRLMRLVHSAEDAVKEIAQFYRNFHSSRWLKGNFRDSPEPRPERSRAGAPARTLSPASLPERRLPAAGLQRAGTGRTGVPQPDPPRLRAFNGRDQGRLRNCWTTSTCRKTGTEAAAPARAQSSLRPFNRRLIDSTE